MRMETRQTSERRRGGGYKTRGMAVRGRRCLGEKAKGREARCRVLGFFVMMDDLAVEQADGWRESESRGEGDL